MSPTSDCAEINSPKTGDLATAPLRVCQVNPLEHETDLKALMAAHGHAAFADFFDRGYRALVADGGASWVGFDPTGRIQMSLTQFVHSFRFGDSPIRGGAIGNVMVAQPYRTFFPAVALFKRMLTDTQDRGELDFVYGDPTPGATAISRVVKMEHVGDLDRLVLPVADASLMKHLGATLVSKAPLILSGRRAPDVRRYAAATGKLELFDQPLGPSDRMIARHPISMLRRRLVGFPGTNDFILELRWDPAAREWDALVLVRLAMDTRILSILSVRRRLDVTLRSIIPALPAVARRLGAYRVQVEALSKSELAKEFLSLGFRPRGDTLPIFVKAFSPAGHQAARSVARWEITALDVER